MEENKTLNLKTEKTWRLIYRILFGLVAFFLPILVISIKYKLITHFNGYKLSIIGLILCIIIIWRFKTRVMEWINSWEYSLLKYILLGFSRVYLFIIVAVILIVAQKGLENLLFCIEWVCVFECIAYLAIYPLEEKHDHNVKRLLRGAERKEDYIEALKEWKEGN